MRTFRPAIVLTFGLFALWGFGHRLYETLVPDFAHVFALDSTRLLLAQSIISLVYLFVAMPAAIYSRTFGSKATIVFGLGCWAIGAFLFYPAAQQHAFWFFLFAAAVMSAGYISLEIGANPIIAAMGPPETTVRRLNFAHAMFPIGVLAAGYIGRWVILSNDALPLHQLADAIVSPYMVLGAGVLTLAFIADKLDFPPFATERGNRRDVAGELHDLLSRPRFRTAVGAMACATAVRTGTWAFGIYYIEKNLPGTSERVAGNYLMAALVAYGVGRWLGALLMYRVDPLKLLAVFSTSGIVFGLSATLQGGQIGAYAIVASCFSISIAFATILGTAIKDLGPMTKAGTALMYMGSSGVAVGLVAMHLVWTVWSLQTAMIVPTLGYVGILAFALTCCKRQQPVPSASTVVA